MYLQIFYVKIGESVYASEWVEYGLYVSCLKAPGGT